MLRWAAVRCVSEPDEAALAELAKTHKVAVTLEDGVLDGGFGEKVARYYGATALKVLAYGGRKEFTDREPLDEIYRQKPAGTGNDCGRRPETAGGVNKSREQTMFLKAGVV